MSVAKKHRRKIVCGGEKYVWYVLTGDRDYWERVSLNDWETPFLHIVSEDKALILTIPLNAPTPYAVSKGRRFQGKPTSGCWERYLLPFSFQGVVTPKTIAEIIAWAVDGKNAVKTEYSAEFRF